MKNLAFNACKHNNAISVKLMLNIIVNKFSVCVRHGRTPRTSFVMTKFILLFSEPACLTEIYSAQPGIVHLICLLALNKDLFFFI